MNNPELDKKIRKLISSGDWQGLLKMLGTLKPEELSGCFDDLVGLIPGPGSAGAGHGACAHASTGASRYGKSDERRIVGCLEKVFGSFDMHSSDGLRFAFFHSSGSSFTVAVSLGIGAEPSTSERKEGTGYERTEIILYLPVDFEIRKASWPGRLFSSLCRLCHDGRGFLAPFFMYDNGGGYASDSMFSGCILIPSFDTGPSPVQLEDGGEVSFLVAVPLFDDEMDYKDSFGLGRLLDRLLPDAVVSDPGRSSCADPFEAEGPAHGCIADFGRRQEDFRKVAGLVGDKYAFATEMTYFLIWAIRRYLISPGFLHDNGDIVKLVAYPCFEDVRMMLWKSYDGLLFPFFFSQEGRLFARFCFSPDSYGAVNHYPSLFFSVAQAYVRRNGHPHAGRIDPRFLLPYSADTFKEVSDALDVVHSMWRMEESRGKRIGSEVPVSSALGFLGPSGCLVTPSVFNDPLKGCVFIRRESLDPLWDSGWRVYSSETERDEGEEPVLLMDIHSFGGLTPALADAERGTTYILGGK